MSSINCKYSQELLARLEKNGIKVSSSEMVDILYQEGKYEILLVKLFDRLHNMQTIQHKSPEKIRKITEETISTFLLFGNAAQVPHLSERLYKACRTPNAQHNLQTPPKCFDKPFSLFDIPWIDPTFQNKKDP